MSWGYWSLWDGKHSRQYNISLATKLKQGHNLLRLLTHFRDDICTGLMTQPTLSKHWRRVVSHLDSSQSHQPHLTMFQCWLGDWLLINSGSSSCHTQWKKTLLAWTCDTNGVYLDRRCTGRFRGSRGVQVIRVQTGGAPSTRPCQGWESPGRKQRWQLKTDQNGVKVWLNVSTWMRVKSRHARASHP